MVIIDKSFDDLYFWRYLWRSIYAFILKNDLTIKEIELRTWIRQSYISGLLNWKRTTKNIEKYKTIALSAWFSEEQFYKLVEESRRKELENFIWKKVFSSGEIDFNWILSVEFWIDDRDTINDINKYIEYVRSKKGRK